ncbi:MAG: methyltransferase [Acidimicrobiia bacterium]|nr:MAG: methyltransferase [Acidimicrobiia bacterium]
MGDDRPDERVAPAGSVGYRAPDDGAAAEAERLAHLGALFDGPTIARLRRLGVGPGWECLEVGAGSGSVARALASLVAPTGRVVATDIDLRFLDGIDEPHVEVRRHDVATEDLPPAAFDLAHARGVLEHVRERECALARMVAATRPGGAVVVEDVDWLVFDAQELPRAFARVHRSIQDAYAASAGYDPHLGRRLPRLLERAGLVDVEAEGRVFTMIGGTASMEWYVLGIERSLPVLVDAGIVDARDAADALAEVREPACRLLSPLQVTAWGRVPRR